MQLESRTRTTLLDVDWRRRWPPTLLGHSSRQRGNALDGYLWLLLRSELSVGGNGRGRQEWIRGSFFWRCQQLSMMASTAGADARRLCWRCQQSMSTMASMAGADARRLCWRCRWSMSMMASIRICVASSLRSKPFFDATCQPTSVSIRRIFYFLCKINNDVAKKTTMELVIVL